MITEDYIKIDQVIPLAQAYSETFDAPVDDIFSIDQDEDGVLYGQLMSAGNLYNYAASDTELGLDYQEEATAEINDYARGFLEGLNVHTDSVDAYEWARGYLRLDAKCKTGTPCGGVCLPRGHKCRKGMSQSAAGKVKQTRANLQSGGRKAVGAAGVAAGVLGVAAVGAAGYVGLKNKDILARGGKTVGERLKRAGNEGYGEVRAGVKEAKAILKKTSAAVKQAEAHYKNMPADFKDGAIIKRGAAGGLRGAGVGSAVGTVAGSVEQATVKVGKNLKAAGEDLIRTGKAVGRNTFNKNRNNKNEQGQESNSSSSSSRGQQSLKAGITRTGRPGAERRAITGGADAPPKKKRGGRPKGSKNSPKP